jgi:hypothetical protein
LKEEFVILVHQINTQDKVNVIALAVIQDLNQLLIKDLALNVPLVHSLMVLVAVNHAQMENTPLILVLLNVIFVDVVKNQSQITLIVYYALQGHSLIIMEHVKHANQEHIHLILVPALVFLVDLAPNRIQTSHNVLCVLLELILLQVLLVWVAHLVNIQLEMDHLNVLNAHAGMKRALIQKLVIHVQQVHILAETKRVKCVLQTPSVPLLPHVIALFVVLALKLLMELDVSDVTPESILQE